MISPAIAMMLATVMPTDAQPEEIALVFTHVTVIDMTGALPRPDHTVVVTGDRITAVGKTGEVEVPEEARVVDASGKFMIPGLWDMHVHPRRYAPPLLLANGVVGTRIMWGNQRHVQQRERAGEIDDQAGLVRLQGAPPIPYLRLHVASPIVDGPERVLRSFHGVVGAPDGMVRSLDRVLRPPDREARQVDRVPGQLDRVRGTPDRVRGTPDRVHGTPDRVRGTPDGMGGSTGGV